MAVPLGLPQGHIAGLRIRLQAVEKVRAALGDGLGLFRVTGCTSTTETWYTRQMDKYGIQVGQIRKWGSTEEEFLVIRADDLNVGIRYVADIDRTAAHPYHLIATRSTIVEFAKARPVDPSAEVEKLKELLLCFVGHETNACDFDHHGDCQMHGSTGGPAGYCPTREARELLGIPVGEAR